MLASNFDWRVGFISLKFRGLSAASCLLGWSASLVLRRNCLLSILLWALAGMTRDSGCRWWALVILVKPRAVLRAEFWQA